MDEEDKPLYYGIILACIVGIATTSVLLLETRPTKQEFSELYFYFERVDLINGQGLFRGCSVEVSTTIWIDLNKDGNRDSEETFLAGDTLVLENEFWNISDVAKDSNQILFGKFPKDVNPGDINFSFVIVNHLQEDHSYQYVVTVDGKTEKGTILVKKEEKKLIFQTVSLEREGEYKVSIAIDTGEEIHFYLQVGG